MKKILTLLVFSLFIISCGSSQKRTYPPRTKRTLYPQKTKQITDPSLADKVIWTAVSYKGTRYKYGGTSKKGMDCSGLVYTSFKARGIMLPRSSFQMYTKGVAISLRKVKRGDLLFFKTTNRNRNKVNHVGLVTLVKGNEVKFIHSSSSRGVIITSLNKRYWRNAFIQAKRVL